MTVETKAPPPTPNESRVRVRNHLSGTPDTHDVRLPCGGVEKPRVVIVVVEVVAAEYHEQLIDLHHHVVHTGGWIRRAGGRNLYPRDTVTRGINSKFRQKYMQGGQTARIGMPCHHSPAQSIAVSFCSLVAFTSWSRSIMQILRVLPSKNERIALRWACWLVHFLHGGGRKCELFGSFDEPLPVSLHTTSWLIKNFSVDNRYMLPLFHLADFKLPTRFAVNHV